LISGADDRGAAAAERFEHDVANVREDGHQLGWQQHREHGGVLGLDATRLVASDAQHVVMEAQSCTPLPACVQAPDMTILAAHTAVRVVDVPCPLALVVLRGPRHCSIEVKDELERRR